MSKDNEDLRIFATAIRTLSADMIEKAKSGHPGGPLGLADLAAVLWLKFLKFDPQDLHWDDRDRFVLSGGHCSALLYSLLHFSGAGLSMDDIKQFRQFGSKCPGHPERGVTPGVEVTTGPAGQGFAMAVGMALSFALGAIIAGVAFFRGDWLASIFAKDPEVVSAAWEYLKAYAIDTLLVSFYFCFNGYFNGLGQTRFVMIQGLIGAFCVRLPFSYWMSRLEPVSLFRIGLAIPLSSVVQIALCSGWFVYIHSAKRPGNALDTRRGGGM